MNFIWKLKLLVLCYFLILPGTNGARILFFIGISSYSHRDCMQPLANRMAELGHHVTIFAPMKHAKTHPKIVEFSIPEITQANLAMKNADTMSAVHRLKDRYSDPFFVGENLFNFLLYGAQVCLQSPEFHDWFANNTFDLIVFDLMGKEFALPYAYKMKAKIVFFNPLDLFVGETFDTYGLPLEPWLEAVDPNVYGFPRRIFNVYATLAWMWSHQRYYIPRVEAMVKATIPFEHPPVEQLMKQTDLVLVNDWNSGRSYPSQVVPVGGLHVRVSSGILSKELEIFLEDAEQFIYVSFGSYIRSASMPKEFMEMLYNAVASLGPKTKFLWKWDGDVPQSMPKNVMTQSWFEQQDVLAHQKCKGFVTQGGRMSVQQGIYHAVPMLVVPVLGDQPMIARHAERYGYGIYLELADITVDTFSHALKELLFNSTYTQNMKEQSLMFRERPIPPLDTAVFWLENVLRHNTSRFKSWENISLSWWERRLLDIWGTFFFVLFSVILGVIYVLVRAYKLITGQRVSAKFKVN